MLTGFRERGREGEERERNIDQLPLKRFWPGTEPTTQARALELQPFSLGDVAPTNWAPRARALLVIFKNGLVEGKKSFFTFFPWCWEDANIWTVSGWF